MRAITAFKFDIHPQNRNLNAVIASGFMPQHSSPSFFNTLLVVSAGPGGGPHVKVFDGATGAEMQSFFAYDAGLRSRSGM